MAINNIDDLYNDLSVLIGMIESKDPDTSLSLGELLSKVIMISAASQFEFEIRSAIKNINHIDSQKIRAYMQSSTGRKFWNMFDINKDTKNINHFLRYFGEEFLERLSNEIKNNQKLNDSTRSFILMLQVRNELVHTGFLSYKISQSYQDSYRLYKDSLLLIDFIKTELAMPD